MHQWRSTTSWHCNLQVPGLAVVIVGERKDSQTYVRMKKKACEEVGFASFGADLPADVTQDEVLETVRKLNEDPAVHGILVQLPVSARL
jgi:5,10-methylene-tetrahydrofolate dehydrogenase/methenyl tetrahydrofolate cyclohydrolase